MPSKSTNVAEATMTSKGQITVPGAVRKLLGIKQGDKLRFVQARDGALSVQPVKRRSILDVARENPLVLSQPGRDLNDVIREAVDEAMADRHRRSMRPAKR